MAGEWTEYSQAGSSGLLMTQRFCPRCGGTVAYVHEELPNLIAIPVGGFADPNFPPPHYSVFEERKHRWLAIQGNDIEHFD